MSNPVWGLMSAYFGYFANLGAMPWESTLQEVSGTVGLPVDQVKYVSTLLSGIPLGFLFRALTKDPYTLSGGAKDSAVTIRHTICAMVGITLVTFVFGYEVYHSLFTATVAFALMWILPASQVHIFVSVWAMGYMSAGHIYRMNVDYGGWTIDFTTPQLLVTQKMMNIAFALYDSSRDPAKCTEEQKKRKIDKPPSIAEFYGYVFCLHTLLAGPATDFNDYLTWIDGSKLAGHKPKPLLAVLGKVLFAVVCAILFVVVLPMVPVGNHGLQEWLDSNNRLWILGYNQISLCFLRHRYYFAWVLTDAGCNAAGFGFKGLNKKGGQQWDAVLNVEYFGVEVATNFRSAMTGWNIATSNWLRRCVYERVPSNWKQTASFGMSALWHGFYPGYYLTFCSSAIFNEVARLLRRHLRPLIIPDAKAESSPTAYIYHFLSTCLTMCSLNYLATPFLLLSADQSFTFWRHWYFAPHIIAVGLYFAIPIVFKQKKPAKKTE